MVLLLCRSLRTAEAAVCHSVNRMSLVGVHVVAAVLNGVNLCTGPGGHEYGYKYGNNSSSNERAA